jgi:hypothetical protein
MKYIITGVIQMSVRKPKLFTGLIICECGWKMKYIKESGGKYICGQYSTFKNKCSRNGIKESDLISMLQNHYDLYNRRLKLTNDFLKDEIDGVYVDKNKSIKFEFKNGLPPIISDENTLSFI